MDKPEIEFFDPEPPTDLVVTDITAGDGAEATKHYHNSIAVLGAIESPPEMAHSLLAYGRFLSKSNAEAGREHLERALTLFVDLEATGWIEEAHIALSAISFPGIGHRSL